MWFDFCNVWQEEPTRSSSSMSTSLLEDTSPESVVGNKGKGSNIINHVVLHLTLELSFHALCSPPQVSQRSCLFLQLHIQISTGLHRGGTLLRRRPPPVSALLHLHLDRARSPWYVLVHYECVDCLLRNEGLVFILSIKTALLSCMLCSKLHLH